MIEKLVFKRAAAFIYFFSFINYKGLPYRVMTGYIREMNRGQINISPRFFFVVKHGKQIFAE